MRVAVKTRVAVGVGGTVAGTGVSGRDGVAGTKVGSTVGEGCEVGFGAASKVGCEVGFGAANKVGCDVGFGAANKVGPAEGEADRVGTFFNDDQAKYNSPTNREK